MKILQINNQNYNLAFEAKLNAPNEFWGAISRLTARDLRKAEAALEVIRNYNPADIINFSCRAIDKSRFRKRVLCEYISASKNMGIIITEGKDTLFSSMTWLKLLTRTADNIKGQFGRVSGIRNGLQA